MKRHLFCLVVYLLPSTALAATFVEDFNSGVFNPNLYLSKNTPTFSLSFSGGEAVMTRTFGLGNGGLQLSTIFHIAGDYTTTVDADRTLLGSGSFGLVVNDAIPTASIATDVYFRPGSLVQGNIWSLPVFIDDVISDGSSNTATFRLRRVGTTVYNEVDLGSGFVTLNSRTDPNLDAPVQVSLFLLEEVGASDDLLGRFDNWSIEADQFINFVPEPSSLMLAAIALLSVVFVRCRLR